MVSNSTVKALTNKMDWNDIIIPNDFPAYKATQNVQNYIDRECNKFALYSAIIVHLNDTIHTSSLNDGIDHINLCVHPGDKNTKFGMRLKHLIEQDYTELMGAICKYYKAMGYKCNFNTSEQELDIYYNLQPR